jgi:multidrug efflux pump subunit AcrA (membrane-fusion protein)
MKHASLKLTALAVLVLVGWYFWTGRAVQDEAPMARSGTPVAPVSGPAVTGDIVTVMASRRGSSVTLGGTVVPFKEVTLTAQSPGRVVFIAGAEGDWFEAQTDLVTLDDDDLLARRQAALAEIRNAEAALGNAQMQYSRELYSPQGRSIYGSRGMGLPSMFDQMFSQGFANMMPGNIGGSPWLDRQADLVNRGTQIDQAISRIQTARSQLREVDARVRDARSVAPFDGVILHKLVEVGDPVQPGQPLLAFADTRYLQITLEIPARLMPGLRVGMMVPARLDVGNTRVDARVAQIFPAADVQRHTVRVKLDLPQGVPGGPGMYAEVMIPDVNAPMNTLPAIPESAVVWRGSLPGVFVVGASNETQLRLLRLGDYVSAGTVSVLSGLGVGERIYANPPPGMGSSWSRREPGTQPE